MNTELLNEFNSLGQDLYGHMWEAIRRRNTLRISGNVTTCSSDLTPDQLQRMIDALKIIKDKRNQ